VAYDGGIVLAMVGQQEWWLLPNSPARHGLLVVVVASVLAFRSLGRSRDVTIQGEWLSHHEGCQLSGSRPLLSGPLVAASGALDPVGMGVHACVARPGRTTTRVLPPLVLSLAAKAVGGRGHRTV
jgi:hypothetical protein